MNTKTAAYFFRKCALCAGADYSKLPGIEVDLGNQKKVANFCVIPMG